MWENLGQRDKPQLRSFHLFLVPRFRFKSETLHVLKLRHIEQKKYEKPEAQCSGDRRFATIFSSDEREGNSDERESGESGNYVSNYVDCCFHWSIILSRIPRMISRF